MSNKRKKCFKCKVDGKICPKSANKSRASSGSKSKACPPCIIKVSLTDYSIHIQSEDTEEAGAVAKDLVNKMVKAKHISEEIQMYAALAKELRNNRIKELWATGGFWLGAFAAIFYMLFNLAISNIHWFRFLAVLISLPSSFTLISAFILRYTKSLKEKNFMELVTLALKLNFKGLKFLEKNKSKNILERSTP